MDMLNVLKTGIGALAGGGGNQAALLGAVTSLLGGGGGLNGLVQAFEKQGLGNIVSSWVGTGANLPVSPDQITKGLGPDAVSKFAASAGIAHESASAALASVLPGLVDKLTPNGKVENDQIPGLDSLKSLLGL